jgi:hypothetical protein
VPKAAELVDEVFEDTARFGTTFAALVVQRDEIVAERYGNQLPSFDGTGEHVTAET